ncbi:MAG TPA: hypothetical protein DEB40_02645 [Elusimicrobia bacterium]|nr:hypothetical protein [Elusimicrobiota bacterium]HBT60628.1 hypothetical protein [Elusimicrobiota bacterium]
MAWWNPFKKQEPQSSPATPDQQVATKTPTKPAPVPEPPAPELPKELSGSPLAKGMMSKFYRMWKNPAFIKQLRTLTAHMAKEGVDIKNMEAVKAWIEKNKDAIESGKFNEAPQESAKPETYVKTGPDVGRNDPCPCGSGKKYKKCCQTKA